MEIIKLGLTGAYDGLRIDASLDSKKCGCDECNCYDQVVEETAYVGDGSTLESNP